MHVQIRFEWHSLVDRLVQMSRIPSGVGCALSVKEATLTGLQLQAGSLGRGLVHGRVLDGLSQDSLREVVETKQDAVVRGPR